MVKNTAVETIKRSLKTVFFYLQKIELGQNDKKYIKQVHIYAWDTKY